MRTAAQSAAGKRSACCGRLASLRLTARRTPPRGAPSSRFQTRSLPPESGSAAPLSTAPPEQHHSLPASLSPEHHHAPHLPLKHHHEPPLKADLEPPAKDLWRDTPLRYLGYTNECGEAFAVYLPPFGVPATYAVAAAYVLADTVDKTLRAYHLGGVLQVGPRIRVAAATCVETLSWQLCASVFWPGSLIRVVVASASLAVAAAHPLLAEARVPSEIERALPTLVGLAAIPFVVAPIDEAVSSLMERSVARAVHGKLQTLEEWATASGCLAVACALPPALFELAAALRAMEGSQV